MFYYTVCRSIVFGVKQDTIMVNITDNLVFRLNEIVCDLMWKN